MFQAEMRKQFEGWQFASVGQDKDGAGADEDDSLEALRARRRKEMKDIPQT